MDDANADFRRVTHARGTLAGGERPASRGESGIPRGRSCDIVPAGTDAYLVAPARRGLHRDTRAGYFVVLGPAGTAPSTAANGARRFGPLATREQAEWLRASAHAIGLLEGRQGPAGSGGRPTAWLLQPKASQAAAAERAPGHLRPAAARP
jgi:hypothetical protein